MLRRGLSLRKGGRSTQETQGSGGKEYAATRRSGPKSDTGRDYPAGGLRGEGDTAAVDYQRWVEQRQDRRRLQREVARAQELREEFSEDPRNNPTGYGRPAKTWDYAAPKANRLLVYGLVCLDLADPCDCPRANRGAEAEEGDDDP